MLIEAGGAPVGREAVSALEGWSDQPLANGRDIARHLKSARLSRLPFSPVVSESPTLAWSLSSRWPIVVQGRGPRQAARPMRKSGAAAADCPLALIAPACDLIAAQLEFYAGHVRACHDAASAVAATTRHNDLLALALFWVVRTALRLPAEDQLLDLIDQAEGRLSLLPESALCRFLRERLQLIQTLHSSPADWPDIARRLEQRLRNPRPAIDIGNLAYASNYRALVLRRMRQLDQAETVIAQAMLAAAATGDAHLQQIVLFNAGLILSELAKSGPAEGCAQQEPSPAPAASQADKAALAIRALRLVSRISNDFGIGKDSAQNEILIAELHVLSGEWDAARASLDLARRLVAISENLPDQAAVCHCEAVFLSSLPSASQQDRRKAEQLFDRARELYLQAGRDDLVVRVREDRLRLQFGQKTA